MSQTTMRRVLITGAGGFAGPYLGAALRQQFGDSAVLAPTSNSAGFHTSLGTIERLDVTNAAAVTATLKSVRPTHVIHLAGVSSVGAAATNPEQAWQVNLFGTLNVANALREHCPDAVLISVGSGLVYGTSAKSGQPLTETAVLAPTNGYEATKAAADLALGAMAAQGLRCVRLRPFNHTGSGQTTDFVLPNFALQIARIEAGLQPPVLHVGNLDAERDFLDVRDVTAAYALAVARSDAIATGTILNIASGTPRRIRDLLDRLLALSTTPVTVKNDPARMRPSETPRFVGDASLARQLLGWSPSRSIDETLHDVLAGCRAHVQLSPPAA